MITVVPSPETAVTTPELKPIVATKVLLLVHVPPAGKSVSAEVLPAHIVVVPLITPGAPTVTDVVLLPQIFVAVITVVPPPTLVTTPDDEPTVATEVILLLQVPVGAPLLLRVVVAPKHIIVAPEITVGGDDTVIVVVWVAPQLLE